MPKTKNIAAEIAALKERVTTLEEKGLTERTANVIVNDLNAQIEEIAKNVKELQRKQDTD